MISFAYLTCWSPSSCKIITSDIPLTTFYKVFYIYIYIYKHKKEILLRFVLSTQRNQSTKEIFKNSENLPATSPPSYTFAVHFLSQDVKRYVQKILIRFVFSTQKKTGKTYIVKNGGRPALELDTSINNALPRSRIGIFMDIKFKAGENVKSFAFFFLILGNKRD